jgi:penicillin G amidase
MAGRWRRRLLGILSWSGAVVAVMLVTAVALLAWASRRPFPAIDAEIELPGLEGPVEIVRDSLGIPHIYAATSHDLFMAQGFVHAQDRFWQMDTWRHIGAGGVAEMFGEDHVETDAFLRTMGWRRLAEEQYAAASNETRGYLDAYASGVNAYLEMRSPAELGFEYTILGLTNRDYEPEPWEPADTLVWGKVMAWDLRGNIDDEIDRALLLGGLAPDVVEGLYPPYPDDAPLIVTHDGPRLTTPLSPAPGVSNTALRRVSTNTDLVDALTGGGGEGIGSNSWVVGGTRTTTGSPLLANDPHLGIRMPSIWYQVGLHCTPKGPECPFAVTGFSFAGMPGVIIGHNDRIAWGLTNLGPDVMDLYVERVNPADPDQYEVDGAWVEMEVRTETIAVAGGDPVEVRVRATRNGPVVSDVYGRLDELGAAGISLPEPYVVALRWTALDPGPAIIEPVMAMNRAGNWDEFREALTLFTVPSQNVVYADVDGNIGYQAPGLVPIRRAGDGRTPVPGWDDRFAWDGFIPFDELPNVFNPDEGWIVTANNAVVDGTYPYLLTADWNLGDRAARIVELLSGPDPLSPDDMAAIQLDTFNATAERIRPWFIAPDPASLTATEAAAYDALATWDLHNDAGSAGAAVFEAAWRRLLALAIGDDVPDGHCTQASADSGSDNSACFHSPSSIRTSTLEMPRPGAHATPATARGPAAT